MSTSENKMEMKMVELITKYDNIIKTLRDILEIVEDYHTHREDIFRTVHERVCSIDV
jgi:hypothetical protein